MRRYDYFRPDTLDEALRLKSSLSGSRFIAGGTDLMVQIKNSELRPDALISLRSVSELSGMDDINGTARIGTMTTIDDIARGRELSREYPLLGEAARRVGSVQIRNVATIGGNLCNCSPSSDMSPPLLVLEAKVRLRSARESRIIPLDQFFRGPGLSCLSPDEVMTEILLDESQPQTKAIFLKKGRLHMDLAIASLAVLLKLDGNTCLKARVAAGSVAPVPLRLKEVEAYLQGSTLTPKIIKEARQLAEKCVSPITDIRSTEDYRRSIVGVFIQRGIESLLERGRS